MPALRRWLYFLTKAFARTIRPFILVHAYLLPLANIYAPIASISFNKLIWGNLYNLPGRTYLIFK